MGSCERQRTESTVYFAPFRVPLSCIRRNPMRKISNTMREEFDMRQVLTEATQQRILLFGGIWTKMDLVIWH